MADQRCEFRHDLFRTATNGYRLDGTQCWVDGETAIFSVDGEWKRLCPFHAPPDEEPSDGNMPLEGRGARQARLLRGCLDGWYRENTKPGRKSVFVLPGLRCGAIDLSGYDFSAEIYLEGATFSGRADFAGATFRVGVTFWEATFSEPADFWRATFSGPAVFNGATFSGGAYFYRSTFGEMADFQRATFGKVTVFEEAKFAAGAFFYGAEFGEVAHLNRVTFERGGEFREISAEILNLRGLRLSYPFSLVQCTIGQLSYAVQVGEPLIFNNCYPSGEDADWDFTFQDCSKLAFVNQDLSRARFLGADLNGTRFASCTWGQDPTTGYARVAEHDEIIASGDAEELGLLHGLYQQLKKNLEADRNYLQAGEFHYWEMELRRRQYRAEHRNLLDRGLLWLYWLLADYGESYWKLARWMGYSLLLASLLVTVIEANWGSLTWDLSCGFHPLSCTVLTHWRGIL